MTSTRTRVGTVLYFGAFEDQQHRWGSAVADTATFPLLQGHPGHQHTPVISTRLLSYAQHASWDVSQPTASSSLLLHPCPDVLGSTWTSIRGRDLTELSYAAPSYSYIQILEIPQVLHLNLSSFYIKMWPFLYLPPEK